MAVAAEIPAAERRSGYAFMGRDTQAMQDDDTANPGMLFVLDGDAAWRRKAGAADLACADCTAMRRACAASPPAIPPSTRSAGRPSISSSASDLSRRAATGAAAAIRESGTSRPHRLCGAAIAWAADRHRR